METISTEVQAKDLVKYLMNGNLKFHSKGMLVDTKTRRMVMIDLQNEITRDGRVITIQWENMGGGVYRGFLPPECMV